MGLWRARGRLARIGMAAALVAGSSAPGAFAQAATQSAEAEAPADEKVIVTGIRDPRPAGGTKTDAPIIETPQSVSVIPASRIEAQGAHTLQDALLYSSGVRADSYGYDSRGDWAFIRGVDFVQYLDGLRMLTGYYNTPRPDPAALEQIEILRGPSSVLYGQGSIGGIVNLVSKSPSADFGGTVTGEFGSFGRMQFEADVTGPIGEGNGLSYRAITVMRESDSYVDFVSDDRKLFAPSLTWRPSDDTTLTIRAVVQEDDANSSTAFLPHSGVLLPNPNGNIPFSRFLSEPGFDQYDSELASVGWSFAHRFSDAWQFRQQFRYTESTVNYQSMYPDSYSNPHDPFIDVNDRILNRYVYVSRPDTAILGLDNQVETAFDTGDGIAHSLLAGIDYGYFNETSVSGFDLGAPIDVFTPVYTGQAVPALFAVPENTQQQIGVYLQDQVKIDGRLIVLASLRRDHAWSEAEGSPDESGWATTKRLGVLYRFAEGLTPYVSYSESFQPVAGVDFYGAPFEPLRGKQWEGGLKYQPDGAPYIVTLAAFDIVEQNRLVEDPMNPFNQIQIGEVNSRGFEFEAAGTIFENTEIILSYSYTDITGDDGRQLESVPKHLASGWVMHELDLEADLRLRIGAGIRYAGESYGYILAPPETTIVTPSNTLVDAMIGLDFGPWRVSVNASNALDEEYVATCLGRGDCFVGAGRRVTANLSYEF